MVGGGQRVCQCTTLYIIGVFGVAAGSLKIMYDAQHITLFSWACLDASCYFLLSTGVHLAMPGGFDDMYFKCDCGVLGGVLVPPSKAACASVPDGPGQAAGLGAGRGVGYTGSSARAA